MEYIYLCTSCLLEYHRICKIIFCLGLWTNLFPSKSSQLDFCFYIPSKVFLAWFGDSPYGQSSHNADLAVSGKQVCYIMILVRSHLNPNHNGKSFFAIFPLLFPATKKGKEKEMRPMLENMMPKTQELKGKYRV